MRVCSKYKNNESRVQISEEGQVHILSADSVRLLPDAAFQQAAVKVVTLPRIYELWQSY